MATKKKHRTWGRVKKYTRKKSVKSHSRRIKGIMEIAASDPAYKRAKKRAEIAKRKSSIAYKKAKAKAKKKIRSSRRRY